jgi:hypothetical protein
MSSAALGAAFVYAGSCIAPMHQARVALALGGLGMITAIVFAAFAVVAANYWALWSSACMAFGLGAVAFTGMINRRRPTPPAAAHIRI